MVVELQKASVAKRLAAFMLDLLIFILIAVAIASLASAVLGFERKMQSYHDLTGSYEKTLEEKYDVDFNITSEEFAALTPSERDRYEQANDEWLKAWEDDPRFSDAQMAVVYTIIAVVVLSLFFTFALTEMIVPILFGNGQTLGKKAMTIGVMRVDGVRITPFQVFVRSICGKFLMETMLPVLLLMLGFSDIMSISMGVIMTILIIALQLGLLIFTKTNSTIHDAAAVTVVVDMLTQTIFDTPEDLLEHQKSLAAEEAERQPY